MMTSEIIAKIKRIQIRTKKFFTNHYAGDYKTRRRGLGLDFDQLRQYELGDDVRAIDWKSSARSDQLLIKQYFHESSKTILIGLDASGSMMYSSQAKLKYEVAQEAATIIAYLGYLTKASIGFIKFTDSVEQFIPPRAGQKHMQTILDAIWSPASEGRAGTSLESALQGIARYKKKDALVFMISDFIDGASIESALKRAARIYDLILVRCLDRLEKQISFGAVITAIDTERGSIQSVDTAQAHGFLEKRLKQQTDIFTRSASVLDISMDRCPAEDIAAFFARRLESMR